MPEYTKNITLEITLPVSAEFTEDDIHLDFENDHAVHAVVAALWGDEFAVKQEFIEEIKKQAAEDRAEGIAWAAMS
jgi:hypothetical protein